MTFIRIAVAALIVCLVGCKENNKPKVIAKHAKAIVKISTPAISDTTNEKQEIQKLMRNLLVWAEDGKKVPDLLPYVINRQDSTVTGFDLGKLKGIDDSLRYTGFFSEEFINNYNQIIQLLAKRMKGKEIAPFSTGEIPPFDFHTNADSWCDCQDVPYGGENAFMVAANLVEVHIENLTSKAVKCTGRGVACLKKYHPIGGP